jgi:hypothetical protein
MTIGNKIAAAFVKAQAEMGNAVKDSTNPFFRNKYADLNAVREACLPVLNKFGISVLQPTIQIEGKNFVKTILLHESGETIESLTEILFAKQNDPQAQGSGITYARRYGLQSLVNIGAEDDDGNKAAEQPKGNKSAAEKFSKQPSGEFAGLAEQAGNDIKTAAEEKRLSELKLSLNDLGSVAEIDGYLEVKFKGKSRLEVLQAMSPVNAAQAKTIIRNAKLAVDPEYKGE